MGLSVRAYARRRGVSHTAVQKAVASGRIAALPDGTIDADAADAAWAATTAPRMPPLGHDAARRTRPARAAPAGPPPAPEPPPAGVSVLDRGAYHRTRVAKLAIEAQRAQLELERRRGTLISRDRAVLKAFAFARMLRDAWLGWPARIGPPLAAEFGIEPALLVIALDDAVRAQLEELASERCEF
jgi:hypothetical protein